MIRCLYQLFQSSKLVMEINMGTIHRVEARSIVPMKQYWLCQLAVFIFILIVEVMMVVIVLKVPIDNLNGLLWRASVQTASFILLTHLLLKHGGNWVTNRLKSARITIWHMAILSLGVASLQVVSLHTVIPFLSPVGISDVIMQVGDGDKMNMMDDSAGLFSAFLTNYFKSLAWASCYLTVVSRREKKVLITQLKEQQLASLQNQINPHFLFNSLNTIRGMIYQDQDKAAEIVTQLSELFRYNLTTDLRTHVSVEDEWQICENYLAIEQVRFGERLRVHFDCPQNLIKATLPCMSLLTLVENAVKHGIAHLPNGGELKIHVSEREGKVLVQVINPFDETRIKSGTQLGLANIQSRLELMFGQQAQLLISQERQQFKAIMEVPHAA